MCSDQKLSRKGPWRRSSTGRFRKFLGFSIDSVEALFTFPSYGNTARRKPGPPTDRLWDLDDLGAFLGCADATVTVQMTDFPPALHLKGVRGPRWLASSVQRWFEDAAAQSSMSPQKPRPQRRATGNPVPPLSQVDLAEIAKVK